MKKSIPLWLLLLVVGVGLLAYLFKPNASKKLMKDTIKKQETELRQITYEIDSLQNLLNARFKEHQEDNIFREKKLADIKEKLQEEINNRYDYEKERDSYFSGDFNDRFNVLTANVSKDSVE